MTCQEFQEVLPYIIESGGNADQEGHLRECQSCSELVRDLRYIAEQAKLLLPMHDPSPRVWAGIEQSLARGGLVSEGRTSRPGQIKTITTQTKSWTPLGWALALVAVALFAVALINYNPHLPATQAGAQNNSAQSAQVDGDDQQLLSQVSDPDVRRAYEDNLREVNAYITDAQQAVDRDPQDAAAHEYLLDAYQQKEMLYQMATVRSLP